MDGRQGERLVADVVEQHGQLVLLDGHDDAGPPLAVSHRAAPRELVITGWLFLGCAGRTGVAVAARAGQLLAEVAKQVLPPAPGRFGIAAHHLDPGPDQTSVCLRSVHCSFHRLIGSQIRINVFEPAVGGGGDCPDLFEQVHRCSALSRGPVHLVLELCRPNRLVVFLEGLRHLTENFLGGFAGGEERLQAQVLLAVEQA